MKITLKIEKEFEVKTLLVKAGVLYWEDSEVNGEPDTESGDNVPCKVGGLWMPEIDIETGKILNWKQGTTANIHYKVADCCGWELKDVHGVIITEAEDGYVPKTLCPKDDGYGDYIIMDIDENGVIKDWEFIEDNFSQDED